MNAKASAPASLPGRVVAGYGRRMLVEDSEGNRHRCISSGRSLRAVCGDRVRWRHGGREGVVTAIEERSTELTRPDKRGRKEVLAANMTHVVVVAAPEPEPDAFIVDRYLAAAHFMGVDCTVVFNKQDLPEPRAQWPDEYERAGYPVWRVSARSGEGLAALSAHMNDHTSIFVGQSGVGKSSLLNALVPDLALATQELSTASREGRHTTTASVLHHTPSSGDIIDSPGVRDYAPAPIPPADVDQGYREFLPFLGRCRFANCRHLAEPDCAVKQAAETGQISSRRYESYRRLLRLMEKLSAPPR
ncbi:MAG: ribosome small subunit-dependent GTPase A [Pseudomonadota bacterium]